ncbi:MAG: hypothetical protein GY945_08620 [Rhodobacteraceae bacterium]|nr:hypothetical protein [Paracoccaceae bacterium]
MTEKEYKDSFVARIWLEDAGSDQHIWRGHVRHVHSEEECYFQDLPTMKRFLERISGVELSETEKTATDRR